VADIEPLRALHYDPARAGDLNDLVSPPYDVIDAADRARLLERSPYNVVEIDLPQADNGDDPYAHAARTLHNWLEQGILVRDEERRCGRLPRTTPAPTGDRASGTGSSRACAWRTTAPGASARTSARTPGPRRTACA
jgi:hypothetical protein